MKATKLAMIVAALVVALGALSAASAAVTYYTSEATYLADLASLSTTNIFEGFESSDWDGLRTTTQTDGTVSTQGLNWLSLNDSLSTTIGWARTGNYGVFSSWGDPDRIGVTADMGTEIYGFGGWFNNTTATQLDFVLDGNFGNTFTFTNDFVHDFFGVIDTDGFSSIRLLGDSHYGADDFTVGVKSTTVVPEPATLILFGSGLLGSAFFSRRRRS